MLRTKKTALVTGASAGLGAELCSLFARDGHDLVLVARRRDKLEERAAEIVKEFAVTATVFAEDLTDASAPTRITQALAERGIEVEFLVNNAGFGTAGRFSDLDPKREMEMIQVNVAAPVLMTRLLLPAMLARRSGRILNVGSTAGFQPGPFMADYYASKAFVNSFTEALAFELRGTGVTATVACPGATATEFAQVAGIAESRLFQAGTMGAREVAAHAYRAMMQGRRLAIPGFKNKLGPQALRVAPRSAVLAMTAALNRRAPTKALSATAATR
jgi:hypothetical protein